MGESVIVIGGGLAGLAAATALAARGFHITVLESRGRLGGRAGSFTDSATGQMIDACQHVTMGCCTNFAAFCRTVGIAPFLKRQPCLYFMTPDGCVTRFSADPLPAPLHLGRSFLASYFLTLAEKARIAWGLACLRFTSPHDDPLFSEWLLSHGQTQRTIDRFWGLVLVSALNESPERIGLRYARKVFVDGFLRNRRGFEVSVPTVPLGRLYGEELQTWLTRHGVQLRLNDAVRRLAIDNGRVTCVEKRDGTILTADWYLSAVPYDRLLDWLPEETVESNSYFSNLKKIDSSPITSVHFWFDRAVMDLPHVALIDCVSQWAFHRGEVALGEYYLQVVVSAAREFRGIGHEVIRERIMQELKNLFPRVAGATLLRSRVVTERAATFSAVPGVDQWRPVQTSPVPNLLVAGDWTATGWPATMEGAVRSGYLAAEALLRKKGRTERIVQPDL